MKTLVAILSIGLFVSGFWICQYLYPDMCTSAEKWWTLRMNLLSVSYFLSLLITLFKGDSKHFRFILGIGIGLSASDVIDRLYFDITTFTIEDKVLIILTVLLSYLESYTSFTQRIQKLCHLPRSKK